MRSTYDKVEKLATLKEKNSALFIKDGPKLLEKLRGYDKNSYVYVFIDSEDEGTYMPHVSSKVISEEEYNALPLAGDDYRSFKDDHFTLYREDFKTIEEWVSDSTLI